MAGKTSFDWKTISSVIGILIGTGTILTVFVKPIILQDVKSTVWEAISKYRVQHKSDIDDYRDQMNRRLQRIENKLDTLK